MLCLELLLTISTSRTLCMIPPRMCDFMSLWACLFCVQNLLTIPTSMTLVDTLNEYVIFFVLGMSMSCLELGIPEF